MIEEAAIANPKRPSPWRIPVALLLGLAVPPLGVLAWIALSGPYRREYLRSAWVRAGIGIGVAAALPLLTVIVAAAVGLWPDPNPNPIGFGLLFVAGALVGTLAMAVGVVIVGTRT